MKSIQRFLLVRLLLGATLVLACAAAVVYVFMARSLQAQLDRNLTDRIQGFASILFQSEDEVEFEFSDQLMPEYELQERPAYFELRFADGRLLEGSNSLRGEHLDVPHEIAEEASHWSAPLPDGRPGRWAAQLVTVHHVYPEEGPDRPEAARVRIAVARGREELERAERSLLAICAAVSGCLVISIGLSSWWAVRRGLAPANRLAATLDAVRIEALPESLDAGELPQELEPVALKTDALIRRLGKALERERRTTAGIAHELRTPISELLTVAEVALRNGHDPLGERTALGTVRDVAWRMGRSVSLLLKLARLESGSETFEHARVDLGLLVAELLRTLEGLQRERGVRIETRVRPGDMVEGDRDVLSIVVANLLENAVQHAPRSASAVCVLEREEGAWRFRVENPAPDLCPDDLGKLCEPFWRKDPARSDRQRSGLGLALVRVLADKAGLELGFELVGTTLRASLSGSGPSGASRGRAG